MEELIQVERHINPDAHAIHKFAAPEKFLGQEQLRAGINTIWYGGLPIDTLLSIRSSDTLVVVLNGATSPNVRLPWLSGTGITQGLDVSKLSISDPSLYLGHGLSSAYYAGNQYQPALQGTLVQIVDKVAGDIGAQHIVFLGGSSGGFAALNLSRSFSNSTAVVFNPQTNLWFHRPEAVINWLSIAWGTKDLKDLPPTVSFNATARYENPFENRVIYMQNRTDHHHDRHFVPFLNAVAEGDLQFLVHDEAQGHRPPPKEMIRQVLEFACSTRPGDLVERFLRR